MRLAISLGHGSGFRIDEVAKLKWERVVLHDETLGPYIEIVDAKWDSDAKQPILEETAELLKDLKARYGYSPYVFPGRGQKPVSKRTLARWFEELQDGLGLDQVYTFHNLRASFVTYLGVNGCPADIQQTLARHRDYNTTLRYRKFFDNELREALRDFHPRNRKRP
jgi:integrase